MRFYHYTTEQNLKLIAISGLILPATAEIDKREKPVVWLSTHSHWEPTATKFYRNQLGENYNITFEQQVQLAGAARIEVAPVGLYCWKNIKQFASMKPTTAKMLEITGKLIGANPNHWYGSFNSISEERWRTVELFRDNKWIPSNTFNDDMTLQVDDIEK